MNHKREQAHLRQDLERYINAVVQGLPQKYREALILTHHDGLTQVELAKRLGLSVSAAKSRAQRTRAMARAVVDRCCAVGTDAYGSVVECSPRDPRYRCLEPSLEAAPDDNKPLANRRGPTAEAPLDIA